MKRVFKKISPLLLTMVFATTMMLSACGKTDNLVKKRIDYYDDGSMHTEETYTYDKNGRLTESIETTNYGDGETMVRKYVNKYVGDLLVVCETYDLEGENWELSFVKEYGYDQNGKEVSLLGYGVENGVKELFAVDITDRNSSGNETRTVNYLVDIETDELKPFAINEYEYDESGKLFKQTDYSINFDSTENNLELSRYVLFAYNSDGTVSKCQEYNADDEFLYEYRYTYNENGKQVKEEIVFNEGGEEFVSFKRVSEYDKKGRLIKETDYRLDTASGELVQEGYTVYEY